MAFDLKMGWKESKGVKLFEIHLKRNCIKNDLSLGLIRQESCNMDLFGTIIEAKQASRYIFSSDEKIKSFQIYDGGFLHDILNYNPYSHAEHKSKAKKLSLSVEDFRLSLGVNK